MSSKRSMLAVALLGGVLLLAACEAQPSPSPSVVASPSTDAEACSPDRIDDGGIAGRVVDEEGQALDDILITIETADFYGDTRTGEDGVFNAPGVSGEFLIRTTDIDYAEVTRRVTVPCGELVEVELVLSPAAS